MKKSKGDFLGGPVVMTMSSNAGGAGSIPSQGTKIHRKYALPYLP